MCESRPSQGQAEPLCYPSLPCVPPGFFTSFSSSFQIRIVISSNAAPAVQISAPLPGSSSCSQAPRENKNWLKNSHHLLLSELLTMQIPSLSSYALPSLSLLSPPSLTACYCWGRALLVSLFLLPLSRPSSTSNSYLLSHFSTCFEIERDGENRQKMLLLDVRVQLKMCMYVSM